MWWEKVERLERGRERKEKLRKKKTKDERMKKFHPMEEREKRVRKWKTESEIKKKKDEEADLPCPDIGLTLKSVTNWSWNVSLASSFSLIFLSLLRCSNLQSSFLQTFSFLPNSLNHIILIHLHSIHSELKFTTSCESLIISCPSSVLLLFFFSNMLLLSFIKLNLSLFSFSIALFSSFFVSLCLSNFFHHHHPLLCFSLMKILPRLMMEENQVCGSWIPSLHSFLPFSSSSLFCLSTPLFMMRDSLFLLLLLLWKKFFSHLSSSDRITHHELEDGEKWKWKQKY